LDVKVIEALGIGLLEMPLEVDQRPPGNKYWIILPSLYTIIPNRNTRFITVKIV
jgi:hypothetical protein